MKTKKKWVSQQVPARLTVSPLCQHLSAVSSYMWLFFVLFHSAFSPQARPLLLFRGFPSPRPCRGWALWRWPVEDTRLSLSSKDPQRWWLASVEQKLVSNLMCKLTNFCRSVFVNVKKYLPDYITFILNRMLCVCSASAFLQQIAQLLQWGPQGSCTRL